jgi:hypothetical protein
MWFVTLPVRDGLFIHLLLSDAFNLNAFNNGFFFPNAKGQTASGPYSSSIKG